MLGRENFGGSIPLLYAIANLLSGKYTGKYGDIGYIFWNFGIVLKALRRIAKNVMSTPRLITVL